MLDWVKIGAKCVWIDNKLARKILDVEIYPVKGVIYSIREIIVSDVIQNELCIRLNEIHNPIINYNNGTEELMFYVYHFRPLITKTQEQDIAIFNKLLKTKKVEDLV